MPKLANLMAANATIQAKMQKVANLTRLVPAGMDELLDRDFVINAS